MELRFITNLDKYDNAFPENVRSDIVPRKGENVFVKKSLINEFLRKKLPPKLEVVYVSYHFNTGNQYAVIELWYNKTDFKSLQQSGIDPF